MASREKADVKMMEGDGHDDLNKGERQSHQGEQHGLEVPSNQQTNEDHPQEQDSHVPEQRQIEQLSLEEV